MKAQKKSTSSNNKVALYQKLVAAGAHTCEKLFGQCFQEGSGLRLPKGAAR